MVHRRNAFLNPYLQILIGACLSAGAELLLKRGAVASAQAGEAFGIGTLTSMWTWMGILLYITAFLSWLWVLKLLPLNFAFSLINIVHILVPLGAWLILGELITSRRWAGIGLIFVGVMLVAQPLAKAEEKL